MSGTSTRLSLDDIAAAIAILREGGIGSADLAGPWGRLKLRLQPMAAPAAPPIEAPTAPGGTVVTAPSIGMFRSRHPGQEAPIIAPGSAVRAGDILGLLQCGLLLTPVLAPVDGLLGDTLGEDGMAVGYGDALFNIL